MKFSHLMFISGAIILGVLFAIVDALFQTNLLAGINIFGGAIVITLIYLFQFYYRRRHGDIFGNVDKHIFRIILVFLQKTNFKETEILPILKTVFKSYSYHLVERLYKEYKSKTIDVKKSCISIKTTSNDAKLFVLHALFDISAKDNMITKEEELYIEKVRRWMFVHINTLNAVKNIYLKKGIKSEAEIEAEQSRKKQTDSFSKSFLPYHAFKILGVSPSVTKGQLKKAYRTLAKQYHPDKYHGQSEEIIQKAEDKFQEITEAYEIVKNFKNYK